MRILFIIRQLNYGGAQRQLITLANGLAYQGHEVMVTVYYQQGEMEELLCKEVRLTDLSKNGRWDLLGPLCSLLRLAREFKPDILHGYLSTSNLLATFAKFFLPNSRVIWGNRGSLTDSADYDLFQRLVFFLEPLLAWLPDLIIFNSQDAMQCALENGYVRAKLKVINNGIDTGQFCVNREAGQRLREKWGVAAHERLCGIVGRLHPVKDHAVFIQAAHLIRQSNPCVRFICVGSGDVEYENKLKNLSHELGLDDRIIWAGAQLNMQAVYNALDILVLSSFSESFPNVILEAMACGLACVVTDVGDAAQIVGDLGVVVPPCDPVALSSGIKRMLTRLETISPEEIRARVVENFSVENLVRRTENALMETLLR